MLKLRRDMLKGGAERKVIRGSAGTGAVLHATHNALHGHTVLDIRPWNPAVTDLGATHRGAGAETIHGGAVAVKAVPHVHAADVGLRRDWRVQVLGWGARPRPMQDGREALVVSTLDWQNGGMRRTGTVRLGLGVLGAGILQVRTVAGIIQAAD